MVRDLGWRAALIEPVPFLYRLLKANARQSGPTAHINHGAPAGRHGSNHRADGALRLPGAAREVFLKRHPAWQPIFYATNESEITSCVLRPS